MRNPFKRKDPVYTTTSEDEATYDEAMQKAKEDELKQEQEAKKAQAKALSDFQSQLEKERKQKQQLEKEARQTKEQEERKKTLEEQRAQEQAAKAQYESLDKYGKEKVKFAKQQVEIAKKADVLRERQETAKQARAVRQAEFVVRQREQEKGIPRHALEAGFLGEQRKIMRLIGQGKGREEDLFALRSFVDQAKFGIDEPLLNEITRLRKTLEMQSARRQAGKVLESGAMALGGAATILAGGRVTRGRQIAKDPYTGEEVAVDQITLSPAGRAAMTARGSQTMDPNRAIGMSQDAMAIFATPVRRVSTQQQTGYIRPGAGATAFVPGTARRQVAAVKIPGIKEILGI